jgi:hypothetical protein
MWRDTVCSRIVGGSETRPGQWPWAVALGSPNESDGGKTFKVKCTASILNERYILTAAHCVSNPFTNSKPATHVRLGEHNVKDATNKTFSVDIEIEKAIMHENFIIKNDIAVLKLKEAIHFRDGLGPIGPIGPICKPYSFQDKDFRNFHDPIVIGWGRVSTTGPASPVLKQVRLHGNYHVYTIGNNPSHHRLR